MAQKSDGTAKRKRGPGRPFVKGQASANPGGRAALPEEVKESCKLLTPEMVEIQAEIARCGRTDTARIAAAENIICRAYGKPTQPLANDPDSPLMPQLPPALMLMTADELREIIRGGRER